MRKVSYMIGTAVLGCALLAGCGKTESETTTEATTVETTEATTEEVTEATPADAEEELPAIGTETADAWKIKLTNQTGQDIVGFAVKDMDSEDWSENLLADEDVFADGEKRYLYYAPDETDAAEDIDTADAAEDTEDAETSDDETENPGEDLLTYTGYDIELTFADETTVTLHALSLEDMQDGEILTEDDVYYVEYTSIASETSISTKEDELAVKAQEEAEAEAAAAAAAAADAAKQTTAAPVTEAPATEAPQTTAAPATEAPQQDAGGDECLGDGLTY